MAFVTLNPATPLMCERLSAGHKAVEDPSEWQHVRMEKHAVDMFLQETVEGAAAVHMSLLDQGDSIGAPFLAMGVCFVDDAARSAAQTALEGFGSTEAVGIAHNALAISKACPDAHTLLALYHASDLTTALACYEAAEAAALKALAAGDKLVEALSQRSVMVCPGSDALH